MRIWNLIIICIAVIGTFLSCDRDQNKNLLTEEHLEKVDDDPQSMLNYINNLHVEDLSESQKAIYHIIRSIALERLYGKGYTEEEGVFEAKEYFKRNGNNEMLIEALYRLGDIHDSQSNPAKAINDYLDALTIAECDANPYWIFHMNAQIGIHYMMRYDKEKAERLMEKSIQYLKKLDIDQLDIDAKLLIGKILLYKQEYTKAQKLFKSISEILPDNDLYKRQALRYLSVTYCRQKDWSDAIRYALNAESLSDPKDSYANYLILLYSYYHTGDSVKVNYYKNLLDYDTIHNINIGQQYNSICAEIYQKKGNYKKACYHLKKSVAYEDSIINTLNRGTINELILKYQNDNLDRKNKSLTFKNNVILYLFITIVVVILFGYYELRRKQIKNRYLLEIQIEAMENIERREEQGKSHLKEVFLRDLEISKRIALLKSRQTEKTQSFFKEFGKLFTVNEIPSFELSWDAFYKNTDLIFNNFYTRLTSKYPNLCEKEVQLCCLMLVNFKTDEIAAVWNQSVFSVQKYRSNIRKKIGVIEGGDIIAYLNENM